jgi:hypothetical protein
MMLDLDDDDQRLWMRSLATSTWRVHLECLRART